jgi:hypothetical protein
MATTSRAQARNGGKPHTILDDVLAMAASLANSRKESAAAKFESLAESVRDCAVAMPDFAHFSAYTKAAADSLDDLASYVSDSDIPSILADAREFSRRHPMATFAGSVVTGVIITQLMQPGAKPSRTKAGQARRSPRAQARA